MQHRIRLPDALGDSFTMKDAALIGIGRGRASARDLDRPFHGVRALQAPQSLSETIQVLLPRLREGQFIGGRTAMRIWGYPYPGNWTAAEEVVIVVSTNASRPRTRGVAGVRLASHRVRRWRIGAVPVVDPVTALFMCAKVLSHLRVVILLDSLMTTATNYPGLQRDRPVFTATQIEQRLQEWGPFPGCRKVRAALLDARERVESPKETETRLLITGNGLPEQEVQYEVRARGRLVARSDMAYPELKIAIEYEGDGHRTGRDQWRRDIQRQRELEDLGWIVIRVTELDLEQGGGALLTRIRNAIASR